MKSFFLLVQRVCFEVAAAQELPILTLLFAKFQSPYIHYIIKMSQGVCHKNMLPLPETISSHLNMDGWKTSFLLGKPFLSFF